MVGAEPPTRTPLLTVSRLISAPWERWLRNLGVMATSGAGIHRYGTHLQRFILKVGELPDGTTFSETDRDEVEYQLRAGVWRYLRGVMRGKLADKPTLTANDVNFRYAAVDYAHILRWDGTAWERAPEDAQPSGVLEMREGGPWSHLTTVNTNGTTVTWVSGHKFSALWGTPRVRIDGIWYVIASVDSDIQITLTGPAPVAASKPFRLALGWHYCDGNGDDGAPGTVVSFMGANGTAATNIVPDLTTGAYVKGGTGWWGAVNVAVAPVLSGSTDDESAHTHAIDHDHPAVTSGPPAPTVAVQSGSGATVAASTHNHQVDVAAYVAASGAGAAHHHGKGTLIADATGEPKNVVAMPWIRK